MDETRREESPGPMPSGLVSTSAVETTDGRRNDLKTWSVESNLVGWRIIPVSKYLEPVCPLFWGLNPPKEGPFHSKQGSFGFQVVRITSIYKP